MSQARIDQLLTDIRLADPDRYALVQALRERVFALGPRISEEVKYGGLLYSAGKPFCGIFSYAKHVSLEFSAGASLADPYQVLEGDGKLRRHIKFRSLQDLAEKQVDDYLAQALQAAETS